ncbi:CYFA0S10e04522g1_1 [Cyberlindnera fabianii]|uniref:CYFA0S10e04522g1_1 n=1 Tax=Cyberlindnera fabianii TaxID=36022 RepID=A0A061B5P7_CYBFA|nr:CYFA0S10e04522g1_1 [Cyberlindnera fabianii]
MSTELIKGQDLELAPPASTTEDVIRVAEVIGRAFNDLPMFIYMGASTNAGKTEEQVTEHFGRMVAGYKHHGAILLHSYDHAAVAVWLPPGQFRIPPVESEIPAAGYDIASSFYNIGVKHGFHTRKHWHLQLIARDPARQGEQNTHAISSIVRPILKRAVDIDKVPVVLECAGTKKAMAVYEHWGFKTLDYAPVKKGEIPIAYMTFNYIKNE